MAFIKYKELRRRIQLEGMANTCRHFREALLEGELTPEDFSIRDLAMATVRTRQGDLCGREWVESLNPARGGVVLLEADDAIDSTGFANLTSQLAFAAVMQGYDSPEYISAKYASTITTKLPGSQLIPGVTGITEDMDDDIAEGMPYPAVGFGDDYLETPKTTRKGRILQVSKEAIFHDQTGMVLSAARGIGELLGLRREKMFCKLLAGITNNFKWRGTAYNTYQTAAPWINVKASNGLAVETGWVQVDASEQLFNAMVDPNTGEPILVNPKTIIHQPPRKHQFRQVFRATEFRAGQADTGTHKSTTTPNSLDQYELASSRWLYKAIVDSGVSASDAADWWFHGDLQKAIAWIENWGPTLVQAPPNNEQEFIAEIALRYKISMKGVYWMKEPRALVKNYAA